MSVVYLPKSCIHHYYHGVSFFGKLKDQSCNAQNRRSGEIVSCLFETYKIMSCHMVIICFKQNLTWQGKKCVHIHNQIILDHIGNLCCIFVINVHGFIFQVQNQISTIKSLAQQYVFEIINTLHAVLCTGDAILTKRNNVNCVRLLHIIF